MILWMQYFPPSFKFFYIFGPGLVGLIWHQASSSHQFWPILVHLWKKKNFGSGWVESPKILPQVGQDLSKPKGQISGQALTWLSFISSCWLTSASWAFVKNKSTNYCPSNNLASLSYSMPAFSVNSFRVFLLFMIWAKGKKLCKKQTKLCLWVNFTSIRK